MTTTRQNGKTPSDPGLDLAVSQTAQVQAGQTDAGTHGTADADRHTDLAAATVQQRAERRSRAQLIGAAHRMGQRVRHPDGGDSSVAEIQQHETSQRNRIEAETSDGSRKHRRLPPWIRRVPVIVLLYDCGLLLYFFAGITNVNWANPLSMSLAFAALLASMVTVLSYGFLAFTGNRMRSHKNHSGTVHLDELDGFTRAALAGCVVGIVVLATLMFIRMRTEVFYSLGSGAGGTALLIALALAVVSAQANLLVLAVHAFDGSDQVARLSALSRTTRRPLAKAHRMARRASISYPAPGPAASPPHATGRNEPDAR